MVNNTDVFDEPVPVGNGFDDIWEKVIATNLTAHMHVIRAAIPIFERQGGGSCSKLSSHSGVYGRARRNDACGGEWCCRRRRRERQRRVHLGRRFGSVRAIQLRFLHSAL